MKKITTKLALLVLVVILSITACTPTTPAPTEAVVPAEAASEEPVAPTEEVAKSPFTIQADPGLIEAVTVLYQAYAADEALVFVEADADLLVTAPSEGDVPGTIPATFLPGAVLIPQTDSIEAAEFIDFAISIDGQQALIDAGLLPTSITVTDQAGNTVEIAQPVQRVLSAYGPATAMIYGVDGEDPLVAASYLGARDPSGAANMAAIDPRFQELVGDSYFSQSDFNVEEAARLDPDLIIASARTAWLDTASELGIPYVLYDAETPERLTEAILMTGELFGPHSAAQAQAWVDYYDWLTGEILAQTETIADEDRPKVLFTGADPLRVASGDMYQTSLIEIAGGVSVSAELTGYWNDVNLEQIAAWDPDVIIVPPYGGATVEAITENPDWQILTAVQEGRVYQMPKLVIPWDTPSSDSVLGIIWLSQHLFPELATPDCAEQANFFYNTFYNYAITTEEIDSICAID
ncbi:MAG: ABC transporter substrate-binding protein [Anaerolineaceae bacterium]|nr:ABC transporter substrate-binding protein [Anaerolineaceae bacterium]